MITPGRWSLAYAEGFVFGYSGNPLPEWWRPAMAAGPLNEFKLGWFDGLRDWVMDPTHYVAHPVIATQVAAPACFRAVHRYFHPPKEPQP